MIQLNDIEAIASGAGLLRAEQSAPKTALEALMGVSFLEHIPADVLEAFSKTIITRRYGPGEQIMLQGSYGHSMFVLLGGRLVVSAHDGKNTDDTKPIERIDVAGSYVGEQALLGQRRRMTTVTTETDAVLLEVQKTRLAKLDRDVGGIFKTLEKVSSRRSIAMYLGQHRSLAFLAAEHTQAIAEVGDIAFYERGAVICHQGERLDTVVVVKVGVARFLQVDEDGEETNLSYLNAGDILGLHFNQRWPGTLIATGHVEVITVPRDLFHSMVLRYPMLMEMFHTELALMHAQPAQQDTSVLFVQELVDDGAHEGLSLLTINLNTCIRCGNCVRACKERHGDPKLIRRGKKLVRREEQKKAGQYETVLIPSSCRHCVNPVCMIGCPTNAIHRTSTGEVDINSDCIGCGNCAMRCPWDNISMIPTPGRVIDGQEMRQIASKCNLCAGYATTNCTHNCPTNAILRLEPTSYYAEVEDALGGRSAQEKVGGARTKASAEYDRSTAIVPAFAGVLVLVMMGLFFSGGAAYQPQSVQGVALGVLAFGCMFGAVGLAGRRRLMRFRTQYGAFAIWARLHFYLGGLSLLATLLHSGFSLGGTLTTTLMLLVLAVVATGVFGLLFYRWMPKTITRLEGDSQVEEDLRAERALIATRIEELLDDAPGEMRGHYARIQRQRGFVVGCYRTHYTQEHAMQAVHTALETMDYSDTERHTLERLGMDLLRIKEIRACLGLYGIRRGFLVTHIGVTAIMAVLIVTHIIAALFFWV